MAVLLLSEEKRDAVCVGAIHIADVVLLSATREVVRVIIAPKVLFVRPVIILMIQFLILHSITHSLSRLGEPGAR